MGLTENAIEAIIKKLFEISASFFGKKKKRISEFLKHYTDISERAYKLVKKGEGLCIDGVFLCIAYNGGKKNKPYRFRSKIGGDWDVDFMEDFNMSNYRRIPIDHEFALVLEELKINGVVSRDPWKMSNTKLRAEYVYEGWQFVRYHYIEKTWEGIWFLKVVTVNGSEKEFDEPLHEHLINMYIKDVCNMLEKYKK